MVWGGLRLKHEMSSQVPVFETWSLEGGTVYGGNRSFEKCDLARGCGSLETGSGDNSLVLLSASSVSKI